MSETSPLDGWKRAVVRPVDGRTDRHVMHSYFNACPESPDGRWVVCFRATDAEGHVGEVTLIDRASGAARVLDEGIVVEDAHRQSYQQWSCGGKYVVYQALVESGAPGQGWQVRRAELSGGRVDVLAEGRQIAWGQPHGRTAPLMGPHWNPDGHRDLELLDVETGRIETVLTAEAVRRAYPEFIEREYGGKEISIFFPVLSPDGRRVFFKPAAVKTGEFRGRGASHRQGLIGYDLAERRFLLQLDLWGHPAWHPDSRTLVTPRSRRLMRVDTETGEMRPIEGLPEFPGSHPGWSPDGRLISTDTLIEQSDGTKAWAVAVADPASAEVAWVHRPDGSSGAASSAGAGVAATSGASSWRPPHPHPVFSADGRRLYFNVNVGPWTRLHEAEVG